MYNLGNGVIAQSADSKGLVPLPPEKRCEAAGPVVACPSSS